jgi:hypothetical protein
MGNLTSAPSPSCSTPAPFDPRLFMGDLTPAPVTPAPVSRTPNRRYASDNTPEYAFADVRRSLAKLIADGGFGIDCREPGKSARNPLITIIMRLVA